MTWLVIIAAALGTYLVRISMVVLFHRRELPDWLEPTLALAGPAVLGAVIAAAVATSHGTTQLPATGHLLALGAGAATARRTGSSIAALAVGLPVSWAAAAAGWT